MSLGNRQKGLPYQLGGGFGEGGQEGGDGRKEGICIPSADSC